MTKRKKTVTTLRIMEKKKEKIAIVKNFKVCFEVCIYE